MGGVSQRLKVAFYLYLYKPRHSASLYMNLESSLTQLPAEKTCLLYEKDFVIFLLQVCWLKKAFFILTTMSKQAMIVCAVVALTLCIAPSTAAPRSRRKEQAIFENLSRIMAKTYHSKEVRWPGYNRVIDSLIYDYAEDAVTNLHEKMEMLPSDGRAVSQILKLVILNDTEESKYQEVEEMLEDVEQIEFEHLDKFFNFWRDKAKAIVKLYYDEKQ